MNNNYSKRQNLYSKELLALEKRQQDDSSSDSEFSDGYDIRLDDDFNNMLKTLKKKADGVATSAGATTAGAGDEPITPIATRITPYAFLRSKIETVCSIQ